MKELSTISEMAQELVSRYPYVETDGGLVENTITIVGDSDGTRGYVSLSEEDGVFVMIYQLPFWVEQNKYKEFRGTFDEVFERADNLFEYV